MTKYGPCIDDEFGTVVHQNYKHTGNTRVEDHTWVGERTWTEWRCECGADTMETVGR